jgi:DNA polymerase III subunit gamma/tau
MEYQVLARKWRPKTFAEVIGQQHITNSLQNAISQNKIGHAYILTGTRGIGKTSVARLFAKALRCERLIEGKNSCGQCNGCVDFDSNSSMNVLEIDGASNNSVDDARDIINNVHYLPTSGKYKIYIIDEVHMLSPNAFNALLKTLEEPPEHVIFIFATTEPQKLLGTVLSRCQRFDFRNASLKDLVLHLDMIAASESIKVENEKIFQQIAKLGSGSVRDTLSLLDQVLSFASDNIITEEVLASSLGLAKTTSIAELTTSLLLGDVKSVSNIFRNLIQENIQLTNIVHSLLDFIFEAIENIDDNQYLENNLKLNPQNLESISTPELMWIFENIGKEASWILESIDPVKVFEIQLQKLTMRREIISFEYGAVTSSQKKKIIISKPKIEDKIKPLAEIFLNETREIPEHIKEEIPVAKELMENQVNISDEFARGREEQLKANEQQSEALEKSTRLDKDNTEKSEGCQKNQAESWEDALILIKTKVPATGSFLERTNLLSPIKVSDHDVRIELGIPQHEKIMFDHMQEDKSKLNITNLLEQAFKKKIYLNMTLLDEKEIKSMEFKTKVEIIEEAEEKKIEAMKNDLINNEMVKKAEKLFNTKVDRVILNKQIK